MSTRKRSKAKPKTKSKKVDEEEQDTTPLQQEKRRRLIEEEEEDVPIESTTTTTSTSISTTIPNFQSESTTMEVQEDEQVDEFYVVMDLPDHEDTSLLLKSKHFVTVVNIQ
jgi:hypothetical protein